MTSYFHSLAQTSVREIPERCFYRHALAGRRGPWETMIRPLAAVLIVIGLLALICRWTLFPNVQETPLLWIGTLFFALAASRIAALSYVAVFKSRLDSLVIFATYTSALLTSPVVIADTVNAYRASPN